MMFLVIFGSLAVSMAIVAEGNLATADSHLKITRTLASAETGLTFVTHEMNRVIAGIPGDAVLQGIKTREGIIDTTNASALWDQTRAGLVELFGRYNWPAAVSGKPPYVRECTYDNTNIAVSGGKTLAIGPIWLGPDTPPFSIIIAPHPLWSTTNLNTQEYGSAYYNRPPYSKMIPAVSSVASTWLDATWLRIRVESTDGAVTRAVQADCPITKTIPFAILSRSRVMIGPNVNIQGPVGSAFTETDLPFGHPVQMESDFYGLDPALDAQLDAFRATLITNDVDGDNRINLADPRETAGITNPQQYDTDGDGYITDFDFFMALFDKAHKGYVTAGDLSSINSTRAAQIMQLIDKAGDPSRPGYNDGQIDANDHYAKVQGQVMITADKAGWQNGAAGGAYQDYFQGPIVPDANQAPLTFQASTNSLYQFSPSDFDVSSFKAMATNSFATSVTNELKRYNTNDASSPQPVTITPHEAVPYQSAHPYDYYDRPVYKNMNFTNVSIPPGTNALFQNCTFIGVTFVQTNTNNTDAGYNYAGMQQADGTQKYPGLTSAVNGTNYADTKPLGNNLRFDGCTFRGSVVTDAPTEFTHVRNKLAFTGNTAFTLSNTNDNFTADQVALYKSSTILAPQYSIDMGAFVGPYDPSKIVQLTGTIVAGIIDMRGQIEVTGTVLTTFLPQSNTGPVIGTTSPNFNVTLGYFSSAQGDLEEELPTNDMGVIHIRYDPTIPVPEGILGPIQIAPNLATYFEAGAR
jgi:hypothetical protein